MGREGGTEGGCAQVQWVWRRWVWRGRVGLEKVGVKRVWQQMHRPLGRTFMTHGISSGRTSERMLMDSVLALEVGAAASNNFSSAICYT